MSKTKTTVKSTGKLEKAVSKPTSKSASKTKRTSLPRVGTWVMRRNIKSDCAFT